MNKRVVGVVIEQIYKPLVILSALFIFVVAGGLPKMMEIAFATTWVFLVILFVGCTYYKVKRCLN